MHGCVGLLLEEGGFSCLKIPHMCEWGLETLSRGLVAPSNNKSNLAPLVSLGEPSECRLGGKEASETTILTHYNCESSSHPKGSEAWKIVGRMTATR